MQEMKVKDMCIDVALLTQLVLANVTNGCSVLHRACDDAVSTASA